ncbi:hypothetical protein JMJ77_0001222, partial [Colletotrichum scovillei]
DSCGQDYRDQHCRKQPLDNDTLPCAILWCVLNLASLSLHKLQAIPPHSATIRAYAPTTTEGYEGGTN